MLQSAKNDIIEVVKGRYQRPSTNAFNLISAGQGKSNYTTNNASSPSPASYFQGGHIMPRVYTRIPLETKFWSRVDKSGGPDACWLWTGGRFQSGGYGLVSNWPHSPLRANRVSYELHYGPIPEGLVICHKCDNPPCVNPAHLFAGTHKDNMQDCKAKGRSRITHHSGETHYHTDLTQDQVDEMRELYNVKGLRPFEIASQFGIKYSRCYLILRGYNWKGKGI